MRRINKLLEKAEFDKPGVDNDNINCSSTNRAIVDDMTITRGSVGEINIIVRDFQSFLSKSKSIN